MSQVSSWYGPGTWGAWFLTLCGSWVHIFVDHHDSPVDLDAWSYLAYANWAAVDVIRHSYTISQHRFHNETAAWQQEAASLAAPMTVVFWTTVHGAAQFFTCRGNSDSGNRKQDKVRAFSLVIGLALPSIAFAIHFIMVYYVYDPPATHSPSSNELINFLPALYYPDMLDMSHFVLFFSFPTALGALYIEISALCLSMCALTLVVVAPIQIAKARGSKEVERAVRIIVGSLCLISFVYFRLYLYLPYLILVAHSPLVAVLIIFFGGAVVPVYAAIYTVRAYLLRNVSLSQSCFFMPCAPQSMSEWDQAGALFVGLLLCVGGEGLLPLYLRSRKKRQETQTLEHELLELRLRAVRRANTVTLEAGEDPAPTVVRRSSGFEADHAVEGAQQLIRVNSGLDRS